MMFNGGAKPFPVVYCDGKREFVLGNLIVYPTMNINNILSILGHKIGISPHQFYVFIADKITHRKILFTANLNLAAAYGAVYIYVRRYRRFKKSPVQKKKYPVAPSYFDRAEFERRMRNLHKKGDPAFLMRMNAFAYLARGAQMGNGGGSGGEGGRAMCKECLKAEVAETDAGFHLCVRDEVVVGFRPTAGPISRPVRSSGMVFSGEYGH